MRNILWLCTSSNYPDIYKEKQHCTAKTKLHCKKTIAKKLKAKQEALQ